MMDHEAWSGLRESGWMQDRDGDWVHTSGRTLANIASPPKQVTSERDMFSVQPSHIDNAFGLEPSVDDEAVVPDEAFGTGPPLGLLNEREECLSTISLANRLLTRLLQKFLDAKNSEALGGDIEEQYRILECKHSSLRALLWYGNQVGRSLSSLGWTWAIRGSGFSRLIEILRRSN